MRVRAREGFFFCLRASFFFSRCGWKKCVAKRRKPNCARIFFYVKPIAGVDGSAERRFHRAERGFLRDIRARERRMDVRASGFCARGFCTFFSSPPPLFWGLFLFLAISSRIVN